MDGPRHARAERARQALDAARTRRRLFPIAGFPSPVVLALYPVLPWIGVIAMGYGFSEIYALAGGASPPRCCRARRGDGRPRSSSCATPTCYGDPLPWSPQADAVKTPMSFFNVQKYGPSLLFVLATLAPAMLALGLLDGRTIGSRARRRARDLRPRPALLLHGLQWLPAHLSGIGDDGVAAASSLAPFFMNFVEHVHAKQPPDIGGPLWLTYLCWAVATVLLYFPVPLVRAREGHAARLVAELSVGAARGMKALVYVAPETDGDPVRSRALAGARARCCSASRRRACAGRTSTASSATASGACPGS